MGDTEEQVEFWSDANSEEVKGGFNTFNKCTVFIYWLFFTHLLFLKLISHVNYPNLLNDYKIH
jgi:hypothetical protein